MKTKIFSCEYLLSDVAILSYLAIFKFLIHFVTNALGGYGYFRDEFYYIACGEHLDFGYVDHPPLVALIANVTRFLFGDSLLSIRFFPAVAGALMVLFTGLMTRSLGGGRFAQILSAISVIIVPAYLVINNFLSMNAFDQLFWILGAYIVVRIIKEDNSKLWLLLGLIVGIGLQNKYSMLFFSFGLFIGFIFTQTRKYFLNKWLWLGSITALFVFLPNIIWEIKYDWPTLEFMRNAQMYKNLKLSPLDFISENILQMHPVTFPIWFVGLLFYLFSKDLKQYRLFGFMYLAILILFISQTAKAYYLASIYPILFASGSFAIEKFIQQKNWNWLKSAILTLLITSGIIILPYGVPVLSPENFIKYMDFIGIRPGAGERHERTELPQYYADMFGWDNMVETVAKVYNGLPEKEKKNSAIYTQNYGQAGAIDFFGKKYGLPKAISGHNNYWLWEPNIDSLKVLIIIGGDEEDHKEEFDEVQHVDTIISKYAMPYETNLKVFVCRKPKFSSIKEVWKTVKFYI